MSSKNAKFNRQYWDSFYKQVRGHIPSQFGVSVLTEIDPGAVVVEFGSGNGRDAHYFADQGHITVAMDVSHEAIKHCEEYAVDANSLHSTFIQGDLTNAQDMAVLIDYARHQAEGREIVFYSRFVMHSLDDVQERSFLKHIGVYLLAGETIYFEFRSKEDATLKKMFGGHYRRYVDTDAFAEYLAESLGFVIEYQMTGRGMAKYKDEDPFISRIIARKR